MNVGLLSSATDYIVEPQVSWDSLSSLVRQLKRLQSTFSKRTYSEMLGNVEAANRDLAHLVEKSLGLEPTRRRRPLHPQAAAFRLIRQHARVRTFVAIPHLNQALAIIRASYSSDAARRV